MTPKPSSLDKFAAIRSTDFELEPELSPFQALYETFFGESSEKVAFKSLIEKVKQAKR